MSTIFRVEFGPWWEKVGMRKTVNIEGQELSYREENPLCSTSVIFIHGNSQAGSTFLHQLRAPELKDYRLIAIDLPGHGFSGRTENYSIPALVKVIRSFISCMKLEKFVLAGHSLGGHLVLEALKEIRPAGILISGAPPLSKPMDPSVFRSHPQFGIFYSEKPEASELEALLDDLYNTPEERAAGKFEFLQTDPLFRPALLASIGAGEFVDELAAWKNFSGVKVLTGGSLDRLINFEGLASAVPEVHLLDGGHNIHQQGAAQYNQALLGILRSVSIPSTRITMEESIHG